MEMFPNVRHLLHYVCPYLGHIAEKEKHKDAGNDTKRACRYTTVVAGHSSASGVSMSEIFEGMVRKTGRAGRTI